MEVINTTSISLQETVEFLLNGGGLEGIVGGEACACFGVSRELNAPDFFEHLISHVATIDSTTRNHIAFVVFYGESILNARATPNHKAYQVTRAHLEGVSFSCEVPRLDKAYGELF